MNLLSAFMGEVSKPQTADETIDKLCDRIIHSTLLEDRRAAVLGLKGLSRQYQLQVGTKGMSILLHILHQDRVDPEVAKAILETLINLCDANTNPTEKIDENLGIQFTEIFVKDAKNVSLLLSLLAETDFHVRFNDIDLIKVLLKNKRKPLQDAILTSPMGVSRLMDLLDDGREVIRNEGLLLLIDLTNQNADIQKIIAFENAFERLLQIIYSEGACDGDVIVQDCMHLIYNLLGNNVSNQNYFRESGLIPKLKPFFKTADLAAPGQFTTSSKVTEENSKSVWNQQKATNVKYALDVIKLLVVDGNPNTPINQKSVANADLLNVSLQLGLLRDVPADVRAQALSAAASLINSNPENQKYLSASTVEDQTPAGKSQKPLMYHYIWLMIDGSSVEQNPIRTGSFLVLSAFLNGNVNAQKEILSSASTLGTTGALLISSILDWEVHRKDPLRCWYSSGIVSFILLQSQCKEPALSIKISDQDSDLVDLMYAFTNSLLVAVREQADIRVVIALFSLLSCWLHKFPKAVKGFLSDGSNFTFLIEQISHLSSNVIAQGLAAFTLGLCFEYNDDSVPQLTRSELQNIVINRIGADQYVNRLNRFKEELKPEMFTSDFIDLFKSEFESVQKSVVSPKMLKQRQQEKEESKMQENIISSYKAVIASQDKEIAELKAKLKASEENQKVNSFQKPSQPDSLSSSAAASKSTLINGTSESNDLKTMELNRKIEVLTAKLEEMQVQLEDAVRDRDDALVFLAEQDAELEGFKNRLRELGEVIESDDETEDQEL